MHNQNLETYLWAEASSAAVYIQNRCPHSHLENKTPEEAFTRIKPNISHLRIFCCPVYIHIPKEKRSKLEPSEKKGILVGYSETSKAYRVYILGQRHIELSKDVIFEEDIAFKRSKDENEINNEDSQKDPSPEFQRETQEIIEDNNFIEPMDIADASRENKKRPLWVRKIIEEAGK